MCSRHVPSLCGRGEVCSENVHWPGERISVIYSEIVAIGSFPCRAGSKGQGDGKLREAKRQNVRKAEAVSSTRSRNGLKKTELHLEMVKLFQGLPTLPPLGW